jgi:hypothetical protein
MRTPKDQPPAVPSATGSECSLYLCSGTVGAMPLPRRPEPPPDVSKNVAAKKGERSADAFFEAVVARLLPLGFAKGVGFAFLILSLL